MKAILRAPRPLGGRFVLKNHLIAWVGLNVGEDELAGFWSR
jgi:hypothetical protein